MTPGARVRHARLAFAVVLEQEQSHAGEVRSLGLDTMADLTGDGHIPGGQSARNHGATGSGARERMDYTPPVRTGAFKAAGRHTARVKFLKRFIILGSLFGVSIIAIVVAFDPFRHLPRAVSLAGVGVSGTRITMDSPKISGLQQGGGPYEIKAKAGVQDILKPSLIELVGVDAKVGMADRTTTHILSSNGLYDSKMDSMTLTGDVRIANSSGYTFNMKSALMDFKAGIFSSHERLRVDLKGGEVSADDMQISNNGHVIAFRGHISSMFDPPEETSDDVPPATEPLPQTDPNRPDTAR